MQFPPPLPVRPTWCRWAARLSEAQEVSDRYGESAPRAWCKSSTRAFQAFSEGANPFARSSFFRPSDHGDRGALLTPVKLGSIPRAGAICSSGVTAARRAPTSSVRVQILGGVPKGAVVEWRRHPTAKRNDVGSIPTRTSMVVVDLW